MALMVFPAQMNGPTGTGSRLDIYPGAATPAIFAASTAFWIGYGFAAEPDGPGLSHGTRFELEVDGDPSPMSTDRHSEAGRTVRTTDVATFPSGFAPGWHHFTGRWYEDDRLILSARTAIQFVDA